jgi:hypothetical protein
MAGVPSGVQTMGGLPLDLFIKSLDDVFINEIKTVKKTVDSLFSVEPTTLFKNTEYSLAGLDRPGDWNGDGDNMKTSTVAPRYEIPVTQAPYALEYPITWKMQKYDLHSIVTKGIQSLSKSMMWEREAKGAALLSGGFTTYWNTTAACYLFSASHTLDPRATIATTYGNLVTGALSVTTLMEAIDLMAIMPDDMGKIGVFRPAKLVHPTALRSTVDAVLNTGIQYRAGGNDFDKNPLTKYGLEPVEWPQLDLVSSTAWFLVAEENGLGMKESQTIKTQTYNYPNLDIGYKAFGALKCFARDPRGVVGSLGT